jgi:predicted nucleic acid-binding protein
LGLLKVLLHLKGNMILTGIFKMLYIIDTHAWVEYFKGSKLGATVKKLFDNQNNSFVTVTCSLAELKCWALRIEDNFDELLQIVRSNSTISSVSEENWIDAASIRHEQRKTHYDFGLIDALILAKQKELHGMVISGDKHFKLLRDVVFLE